MTRFIFQASQRAFQASQRKFRAWPGQHPRVTVAVALLAVWGAGVTLGSQRSASSRSAAAMTTAANRWLEALTPEQRQQATFPNDTEEKVRWNFIPTNMFPRKGVPWKEMSDPQRKLAHELLKAGLSQKGYVTATSIMELETILHAIENSDGKKGANVRDPELYFFTIFGAPSAKSTWGWRVEGHHVSLHFTIANDTAVANTPAFFGTNPAEVRVDGPKKGLRILGSMEDAARALMASFDDAQRATAVYDKVAPTDILTKNSPTFEAFPPAGVTAATLKPAQKDLLMKLIESYTVQMADDVAADRLAKIRQAGVEKVMFAWAGETEVGKKHYYRIQGPTFLVEYDNTQNDGNHVHSVWRDFTGDFGRDLLREHVKGVPH
jgi:hypothetical protein